MMPKLFVLPNNRVEQKPVQTRNKSWWSDVPMGPPDAILGLNDIFMKDPDPRKINLGVGAYRTNEGKPYRLPSVLKAEEIVIKKVLNKEYLPITGNAEFCELAAQMLFGENSEILKNNLNVSVQCLSGTGGLYLGSQLIKKFFPGRKLGFVPHPTWVNQHNIFNDANIEWKNYRHYDEKNKCVAFDAYREDICKMPEGSIIILHEVAQNPTGMDPTHKQWDEISQIVKFKKILPFFDMAYQGFATGDAVNDAYAFRKFIQDGHQVLMSQCFGKNFGLYGERVGVFHMNVGSVDEKAKVLSQLKSIIRQTYSNPPLHGARLIAEVLKTPELKKQWEEEIKCMATRIKGIRKKLVQHLKKVGSTHNWDHVEKQIGMFCYTGLTSAQVAQLIAKYHIYLLDNGRMAIAGVNDTNVEYVGSAIHDVTK